MQLRQVDGKLGQVQRGGFFLEALAQLRQFGDQLGAGPLHGALRRLAQGLVGGVLAQGHRGIAQQHQRALHRGGLAQRADQAAAAGGAEVDAAGGRVVDTLRVADAVAGIVLLLLRLALGQPVDGRRGLERRIGPRGPTRGQRGDENKQGGELHVVLLRIPVGAVWASRAHLASPRPCVIHTRPRKRCELLPLCRGAVVSCTKAAAAPGAAAANGPHQ